MSEDLSTIIGETIQPFIQGEKYILLNADGPKLRVYPTRKIIHCTWGYHYRKPGIKSYDTTILVRYQKCDDTRTWSPLSTEQTIGAMYGWCYEPGPVEKVLMPEKWKIVDPSSIHINISYFFPHLPKEYIHNKMLLREEDQ